MPNSDGFIPAMAVATGLARATPDAATAVANGLDAAKPCSPTTARPEIEVKKDMVTENIFMLSKL